MAKKPETTDQPSSAGDTPAQIRRAEELRREIAGIAEGGKPTGKPTPREITDAAARAKAGKTED
ncbi:hypothetical protein [Mesorhizobium huakuii]|uniref:Uncharacterized protein n=1 Tax=Mesorhizobium huakuii TaxID=28104 RepID=A0ABZ0VT25_9HYPH|nr:hypothetical protein [Mesorhizobium huakuii]WQC00344.1 hypothetical protein U0R22_004546 [Mesorhizobium huakuii]